MTVRAILFGAVLGLLLLLVAPAADVLAAVVQPVTIAFALGVLARPHLTGGRRTR